MSIYHQAISDGQVVRIRTQGDLNAVCLLGLRGLTREDRLTVVRTRRYHVRDLEDRAVLQIHLGRSAVRV